MKKIFLLLVFVSALSITNAETISFNDVWLLKNKKVCVTEYIAIDNNCYNIGDTLEILDPADTGYYRFIIHYDYHPDVFPLMYRGKNLVIEEFYLVGTKQIGFDVLCLCILENGEKVEVNLDRAILCEEVQLK
jgi:hypothetical protein